MPNMLIHLPKLNESDIKHINWWLQTGNLTQKDLSRNQIAFFSFDKIKAAATAYYRFKEPEFFQTRSHVTAMKLFGDKP